MSDVSERSFIQRDLFLRPAEWLLCCDLKTQIWNDRNASLKRVLQRTEGTSLLLSAEHLQQEAEPERAETCYCSGC